MAAPRTDAELIARYDGRVPRYTSYPTAPHFGAGIDAGIYGQWLAALPPAASLSLYLHVPFCDRLCLYCGCNTSVVRNEAPKRAYARHLLEEIDLVASRLGRRAAVTHVHWGGGTPTSLPPDCLTAIMDHLRRRFAVAPDAEVAMELDPSQLDHSALDALRLMGVNRASLGVQDFDPQVQDAIGRRQSFAETRDAATRLRRLGIFSLNLDLIYGLPLQTEDSVARTARLALQLKAERISVFGYAHVPWMKKHQALIREDMLPDAAARFTQTGIIRRILVEEGFYVPVGLDHFALPHDAMAWAVTSGALHRSFQGYTTDAAPVLIGLGASAIGALPQGYVQNQPGAAAYNAAIARGDFAIARGVALSDDDRLRRSVIEAIMCGLAVSVPHELREEAGALTQFAEDGLVTWDGTGLTVTEHGRPFVRNVAALFDRYLRQAPATPRHSSAV
jgi:oxygen-independent coproporphyrinogen III oxidase